MNQLTPQQAISVLAQAAAQFRGTRQEHEILKQAVALIESIIPKPAEENKEPAA